MKLYVGNLAYSTSAEDVRAIFEQAGAVRSCQLVNDRVTGQSRGFAFVEMESSEEGAQAIQRFNNYDLGGRRLVVNEARPREARPGGFGGGAGAGYGGGGGYRGAPGGGSGYGGGFGRGRGDGPGGTAGGFPGGVPAGGADPYAGGTPGGFGTGSGGGRSDFSPGGPPGGFGARRKSGKGSRRNARSAKRDRKAFW